MYFNGPNRPPIQCLRKFTFITDLRATYSKESIFYPLFIIDRCTLRGIKITRLREMNKREDN